MKRTPDAASISILEGQPQTKKQRTIPPEEQHTLYLLTSLRALKMNEADIIEHRANAVAVVARDQRNLTATREEIKKAQALVDEDANRRVKEQKKMADEWLAMTKEEKEAIPPTEPGGEEEEEEEASESSANIQKMHMAEPMYNQTPGVPTSPAPHITCRWEGPLDVTCSNAALYHTQGGGHFCEAHRCKGGKEGCMRKAMNNKPSPNKCTGCYQASVMPRKPKVPKEPKKAKPARTMLTEAQAIALFTKLMGGMMPSVSVPGAQ